MMRKFVALISGLVFGCGLMLSDMVNPARVLAFLDVTGSWDPTLAFVMAGALTITAIGWMVAGRLHAAILGGSMPPPPPALIDRRLFTGSAIFGIGWGIAGICPGPGFVALTFGGWQVPLFVVAMAAGMAAYNWYTTRALRAAMGFGA